MKRSYALWFWLVLAPLAACVQTHSLEERPCPCAQGWDCCPEQNICVPEGSGSCPADADAAVGADADVDEVTRPLRLQLTEARPEDFFGHAVAMAGDVAAVGAPGRDDAASDGGAVFWFERRGSQGGVWVPSGKLVAPDPSAGAGFGTSVAFAGDRLLVGAPGASRGIYVFERSAAGWAFSDTIEPDISAVAPAEIDDLRIGEELAAHEDRVLILTRNRGLGLDWADVYDLADGGAAHLARLEPPAPADAIRDVALHGSAAAMTVLRGDADDAVYVFDAADSEASPVALEMAIDAPVSRGLAFDGVRIAAACKTGTVCIQARTESGWGAPHAVALELDGTAIVTGLQWHGGALIAGRRVVGGEGGHGMQRVHLVGDSWEASAPISLSTGGGVGVRQPLAVAGEWIAIGTPSSSLVAEQAGQLDFSHVDDTPVATTTLNQLHHGRLGHLVAADGPHLLSKGDWGNRLFWFERRPDGDYELRPPLVVTPDADLRALAVAGDRAIVLVRQGSDDSVAVFALASGDWTLEQTVAMPPGSRYVGGPLAVEGGDAFVMTATEPVTREIDARVYRRTTSGWEHAATLRSPCGPSPSIGAGGPRLLLLLCGPADALTVFAGDHDGWTAIPAPVLSEAPLTGASVRSHVAGDRLAISTLAAAGGHEFTDVFRWTGAGWQLELSERAGALAFDAGRLVLARGPTSVAGYRFANGRWSEQQQFELPAEPRSDKADIRTATLVGDQLVLGVPFEVGGSDAEAGALYVFEWDR